MTGKPLFLAASFICGLSLPAPGNAWEEIPVPTFERNPFPSIHAPIACGGREWVVGDDSVWDLASGFAITQPVPDPVPGSTYHEFQGPLCVDGRLILVSDTIADEGQAFALAPDGHWESITTPMALVDPCCGLYASDGATLYQRFKHALFRSDGIPASVSSWSRVDYPFEEEITGLLPTREALVVFYQAGSEVRHRYRLTGDTAWRTPYTAGWSGLGAKLAAVDGATAVYFVLESEVRDNGAPSFQYARGGRVCFYGLIGGKVDCPDSLAPGPMPYYAAVLGKGRYAFAFSWGVSKGTYPEGSLFPRFYDAVEDRVYPVSGLAGLVPGLGDRVLAYSSGSIAVSTTGFPPFTPITRTTSSPVLEAFLSDGGFHFRDGKVWYRAPLAALGPGMDRSEWTASPIPTTIHNVLPQAPSGGTLYGLDDSRISSEGFPWPVYSEDSGRAWTRFDPALRFQVAAPSENHYTPAETHTLRCGGSSWLIAGHSIFLETPSGSFLKAGTGTGPMALGCMLDSLLVADASGLARIGSTGQSRNLSALPGLPPPTAVAYASGRVFLAAGGQVYANQPGQYAFARLMDAPPLSAQVLIAEGTRIYVGGTYGLARLDATTVRTDAIRTPSRSYPVAKRASGRGQGGTRRVFLRKSSAFDADGRRLAP